MFLGVWLSLGVVFVTGLCVSVYRACRAFSKWNKVRQQLKAFPHRDNGGWPLVGNMLELAVPKSAYFNTVMKILDEHSKDPLLILWWTVFPKAYVYHAELSEIIHRSSKHSVKSRDYDFLCPWLSTGLLTSNNEKWVSRRKVLTPAFHFGLLEEFLPVINRHCDEFVEILRSHVDGKSVDMFPLITLNALDNIAECAMGVHIHALEDGNSEYVTSVEIAANSISNRVRKPWHWPDWIYYKTETGRRFNKAVTYLHDFTDQVIQARKKEFAGQTKPSDTTRKEGSRKRRPTFLDILLQTSEGGRVLSDLDIREEVDTFMFEGHDTVAAAIGWTVIFIGSHPHVQQKIRDELVAVFGEDDTRPAELTDLTNLKYLEMVIKESLRLRPSVPVYMRELTEDIHYQGGVIPKGVDALIAPAKLHLDPRYFPDPLTFDPDNFLPEKVSGRHPFTYVPFSAGPRNCIGQRFAMMELKLVLSSLLRAYTFESMQTVEDITPLADLILRPSDGVHVKISIKK